MKNTHIGKNFYVISFLIALVLLGTYIYLNQTDSEENINVSEKNVEVEKIISKKTEQTSSNLKIEEDQNNLPETDEIEDSQPKEIRIVAEEILYPDEYDFGDSMSEITLAVGKPIKFDARPLIHAKVGDTIELEFGQYHYINKILMAEREEYKNESVIVFYFKTEDSELGSYIYGDITFDYNEKIIDGSININNSSINSKSIVLNNNLALYYLDYKWQKEFYKRGYKID